MARSYQDDRPPAATPNGCSLSSRQAEGADGADGERAYARPRGHDAGRASPGPKAPRSTGGVLAACFSLANGVAITAAALLALIFAAWRGVNLLRASPCLMADGFGEISAIIARRD